MCCLNPNANSFRQGILRGNSFTREATLHGNKILFYDQIAIASQTDRQRDVRMTA